MVSECNINGSDRNAHRIPVAKPDQRKSLARHK
jgi:hypothetical protein